MSFFKMMTMKSQLIIGFSIMVAIIALIVAINIVQVRHALELSQNITDIRAPTANHSMTMLNGVNHALAALRGWMLLGEEKFKAERYHVWLEELHAPLNAMKQLQSHWSTPENVSQLQKIEEILSQFERFQQEIEDIAQTPDNIPALKIFFEQAIPLEILMSDNLSQLIELEITKAFSAENQTLLVLMEKVHKTLAQSLSNIHRFLIFGEPQFQTQFETLWQKNEDFFHQLKNTQKLNEQQQLAVKRLSKARETFSPLIFKILKQRRQPDWNQSNYKLATQAAPLAEQLVSLLEQMTESQQNLLQKDSDAIEALVHNLIYIEWGLLGLSILLAGFFGWFISSRILQQVGGEPATIATITQQVAQGHLEVPLESHHRRITGIYASIQDMVNALKKMALQAHRLAQGDTSVPIVPRSETDILGNALVEMTQRLAKITHISQAIVAGDYSRHIEIKGNNDLLGHALNQMTKKLQQITEESQKSDWLKTGQTQLNERMRGEQELVALTQNILNYLANYINAQVGVFFLFQDDKFQLVSSYAYKTRNNNHNEFKLGEGLVGQAALEKKSLLFSNAPNEHINLSINSGMGESEPHDIFVLPLLYENQVLGVLELATARYLTDTEIELFERVADNIAITLNSAQSRLRMQALLDESQQLTQNLQTRQEEILDREERIRAIVDTVGDAIITIDEKGKIDSFNQAAEQIFGYTWSEVVEQNINMLMPEPYHSEHDGYLQNYLRTSQAKIIGKPREAMAKRKDGSCFPIELSVDEMFVGETRLFTGIVRDITERKKAEEAIRVQQEELQSTNEELRAQQESLQAANEQLQIQQQELASSNEELQSQQEELRIANAELEERSFALEESKKTLQEKARALELSSRYKSEFLANMSHELRTPLNSLLILAQLLGENKNGNLDNKQIEYAKTIYSAGSDLLTLINDILDLSKVEAGQMEVLMEDILLADWIEALEHKFHHVADKKGIAFNISVADNLATVIYTDAQRLKQIINNLLSNAFKFTNQGEVKLTIQRPKFPIQTENEASLLPAKTLAISVTDSGIGIPKDKQALIFEAFKQADGSTNRRFGGTGLGLSISRQLAQLLGGDIHLNSEEGKGSTFTLYIPDNVENTVDIIAKPVDIQNHQVPMSDQKTQPKISTTPISEETTSSINKIQAEDEDIEDDRNSLNQDDKFILIIDDDQKFSSTLMDLAREKDFKCLLAADGKTGLLLAEKYQPHAIILDIGLPQIDGWTVMEMLKDNPETRHIPVHFMSAADQERDAKKMGAIGYLLKPVNMEQLGNAFKTIDRFITETIKHLLIVVDNQQRQQDMLDLVGHGDVQSTTATTIENAIQQLHTTVYDCIILDLNIEQGTGIGLLEKLRCEENFYQIPIIIYADRDLTEPEETRLQQCGDNLTIKAVKSPERLLDEVTLFLHQLESSLPQDKRNMIRMVHDKEAILKNKKVLVVDDDTRNVFALVTVLEDKEMEVVVGKHGQDALTLLEQHTDIDLVLMDVMMPEMDGYEAMQKIRAQPQYRKLPIIALTAKAMKGDKTKCIDAGANDYLSKPVDTDKLISLMRVWLYQ
jgi:PAS domain S-box-containing protein